MTAFDAWPIESGLATFAEMRRGMLGFGPVTAGVLTPLATDDLLSPGSGMNLNIGSFSAVFSRQGLNAFGGDSWGMAVGGNLGNAGLTLPVPPTSQSVIYTIWCKAQDPSLDGAVTGTIFGYTASPVAANPIRQSAPSGCVELGDVTVPSNATSLSSPSVVINNRHQRALFRGVNGMRDAAQRDLSILKFFTLGTSGIPRLMASGILIDRFDAPYIEKFYGNSTIAGGAQGGIGWYPIDFEENYSLTWNVNAGSTDQGLGSFSFESLPFPTLLTMDATGQSGFNTQNCDVSIVHGSSLVVWNDAPISKSTPGIGNWSQVGFSVIGTLAANTTTGMQLRGQSSTSTGTTYHRGGAKVRRVPAVMPWNLG